MRPEPRTPGENWILVFAVILVAAFLFVLIGTALEYKSCKDKGGVYSRLNDGTACLGEKK